MFGNKEPQKKEVDSEAALETALATRFDLYRPSLTNEQAVELLAEVIQALPDDGVQIVSLVGGAASGKSSLAKSLIEKLDKTGIAADSISTDDFNRGTRDWRWERLEEGKHYDPIAVKDFELLNQKIDAIKKNTNSTQVVAVPTYDQASGLAIDAGEENYSHKIGKVDALIVEGDFHPVTDPDLVIFLHVPDKQRLQNRIDRDRAQRSEPDVSKIEDNFGFRQETQHVPHTLPALEKSDIVLKVSPAEGEWCYDVYQTREA